LLVPLIMFRRPLLGAVLSIVADTSDIVIFNLWGWPAAPYHQWDKAFDLYYLGIELWLTRRWGRPERAVAFGLFGWRLIGTVLLEGLGWRATLMAFPNLFEWWFLLVLLRDRYRPDYRFTRARTVAWLVALLIPKLGQEYALHVARWLDQWVFADVVRSLWHRLTG
jgi:hypothetical protein